MVSHSFTHVNTIYLAKIVAFQVSERFIGAYREISFPPTGQVNTHRLKARKLSRKEDWSDTGAAV